VPAVYQGDLHLPVNPCRSPGRLLKNSFCSRRQSSGAKAPLILEDLTGVVSESGKEATIGILNEGAFFGEGCLTGQPLRLRRNRNRRLLRDAN